MLQKTTRALVLTAISVLFSITTAVLGAAPLFILRHSEGRRSFVLGAGTAVVFLMAFKAFAAAAMFGVITVLVFAFYEGLAAGAGLLKAGVLAIALSAGISLVGIGVWSKQTGIVISDYFKQTILEKLSEVPQINAALAPEIDNIVAQAPSAFIVVLAATIWLGVLFGFRFINQSMSSSLSNIKLRDFDFPDVFVWAFIATLPGAFLFEDQELLKTVSLNVFNILVFMYFLKGLAAIGSAFSAYRVSPIWQSILYLFMITQLFIVVAALGLADVWLNIKSKLVKKTAEPIER